MDIIELITNLSVEMNNVANAMIEHSDDNKCNDKQNWIDRSNELSGAAQIVEEWALCAAKDEAT